MEKEKKKEDFPPELLESVRDAVGRRVKLTFRCKVQLEVKGDKVENKVLALASHRAFLLTARVPSKVEHSLNFLDIQSISSNKPHQLQLESDRGPLILRMMSEQEVEDVISHIVNALHRISPSETPVKMMRRLSLSADWSTKLQSLWEELSLADLGPCGGFSHQYMCVCDQLSLPYREEVQWDVDTIYLTQDSRELNLQDFVHLENRDLMPIVAALEFNQWFTKLSTKDYKLSTDVCEQIYRVMSRSSRLEELLLENAGLKSDFAQKLSVALSHNPACALHTINLSNNSLEDKGVCALSAQISKLPLGLKHINLSRTCMSAKGLLTEKDGQLFGRRDGTSVVGFLLGYPWANLRESGVNNLFQALCANSIVSSSLTHLDLSGNSMRGDDLQSLHSFLSHTNHVEHLDLSASDCSVEQVCASLLRGSMEYLSVLNLSKSLFSHRKAKDISPSFKQFFSSAQSLTSVNLSGTKLPLEALKSLLLGLGCNPNLSDVSLDLSCCDLRSGGSQILEGCIAEIPNICSLDISDNSLDSDLTTLLVWLAKNRSIRNLSLGKNFTNIKSKNVALVLDSLVHMIQEEESPLASLSLADSKLKADLSMFLNALGSNTSLISLDISGNNMGDIGAKMLAKALQINTKLRTLVWDRNNVSAQGLQDVAAALEKNYTIRFMPIPIMDAAQALKANPEKTEDALLKMERYLLRNHETRKYLQEQAYRLQQGIVTSTTQQMMDSMCVRVQDHLNSLRFSEVVSVQEDMKAAENLMKDAKNSKTLLPDLYHLRSGARGPCVGAIQDQLESMAGEVSRVMEEQLQTLLVSMVDSAHRLCPHVMKTTGGLRQELLKAAAQRMTIPRSFITTTLMEQSGVDIVNKISEVKLSIASFLSDRIADEILESLSSSQNTLADHLNRKEQPLLRHAETEVLDEAPLQPEVEDQEESPALEDLRSCTMIPKSKRKSILVRMLRPISVAFEMEFDLDKALEEVPIHMEDPPPPPPPPPPCSERMSMYGDLPPPPPTQIIELPPVELQTLQSHTKQRPKPKKRTKPSRTKAALSSAPLDAEQNCVTGKIDEGLDDFFCKKVVKVSVRLPVVKTPTSGGVHESMDKKRESRRSGFFNLIKSRTSRSEKHGAPISPPPSSASAPPSSSSAPPSSSSAPSSAPPSSSTAPPVIIEETPPPSPVNIQTLSAESNVSPTAAEESRESCETSALLRHVGVPVMGLDLLAEMKARQERMAGKKSESSSPEKVDSDKDADESRPEPTPRSKPPSVCPKPPPVLSRAPGPLSPTSTTSSSIFDECVEPLKSPLPAPRLKRAEPSEPESPSGRSPPVDDCDWSSLAGSRQWSSLKTASSPPPANKEERERAKSLPPNVRPPSLADEEEAESDGP